MCWRVIEHNAAFCRFPLLLDYGEALASLEPARSEHVAPARGGHAVQEAVPTAARDDFRLVGALGHANSFDGNIALLRAQRSIGGERWADKRAGSWWFVFLVRGPQFAFAVHRALQGGRLVPWPSVTFDPLGGVRV